MYNATICRNRLKSRLFWKNRFDPPLWRVMSPHVNSCWFSNPSTLISANYYLGPTQQVHGRRLIFSFSSFPSAISSSCPPLLSPSRTRHFNCPCSVAKPSKLCHCEMQRTRSVPWPPSLPPSLSLSLTYLQFPRRGRKERASSLTV